MRSIVIAFTIMAACMVCTTSAAKENSTSSDVSALRREVRALKEELRRLKVALAKVGELNMRGALAWTSALKDSKNEKPIAKKRAKTPAKRTVRPTAGTSKKRAPVRSVRNVGTVRGSIRVPKGEPAAYVYVENVFAPPVRGKRVVIEQKNKRFIPSWAVVRRGTKIEFPNSDKVYHNVFSPSSGNFFDLGLYNSGSPGKAHVFKSAGSADVYCNIHPKMAASILIVPNGHFAKVKPDGSFVIRNVPSGNRKIVAWSPGSIPATQWVELDKGGVEQVTLILAPKSGAHKNKTGRAYGSYQ